METITLKEMELEMRPESIRKLHDIKKSKHHKFDSLAELKNLVENIYG